MFGWTETRPIGHGSGYNPTDYTFEGDGLLYAFQEAFSDLAKIDGMIADMNNRGVNAYAKGYHSGGLTVAQESANAFMNSTAVTEGFLGDVKDKLIKFLTALKDKIKAFFHSAIQYFDKFFKSEAAFVEKYEDEIDKKDLSDFKYKLYEWKMDAVDFKKAWADLQKVAFDEAKKADVSIMEAFMYDSNDWVGALTILSVLKEYFLFKDSIWTQTNSEEELKDLKDLGYREVQTYNLASKGGRRFEPAHQLLSKDIDSETKEARRKYGIQAEPEKVEGDKWDGKPWKKSEDEPATKEEEKKDSATSTIKSITSAQRKQIQRAVMKALGGDAQNPEAFKKEIAKKLRGGKSEPREINPPMSEIITVLKDYKDSLDNVQEAGDELLEGFDNEIDRIKGIESKGDEATKAKNRIAAFTEAKDMYMKLFDVYKNALKERASQYKNCFSAALHYSPKEK